MCVERFIQSRRLEFTVQSAGIYRRGEEEAYDGKDSTEVSDGNYRRGGKIVHQGNGLMEG